MLTNLIDRSCTRCPLGKGKAVPPDLKDGADILVVGEAPGGNEERLGIPMIGDSGRLLRTLFERAGLQSRTSITNVVQCRPPGNRDPNPEEISACSYWLEQIVRAVNPKVIVCTGKYAIKYVAGLTASIGQHNGSVFWKNLYGADRLVACLYHPAYLLRKRGTPAYRELEASWLQTLEQVVDQLEIGPGRAEYPYEIHSGFAPAVQEYSVDLETTGTDPRIAVPVLGSVFYGGPNVHIFSNMDFSSWSGTPIIYNSQYDLPLMVRYGFPMPRAVKDTMVLAHLSGERTLSMKSVARRNLRVIVLDFKDLPQGWEPLLNYSAQDAWVNWELHKVLYSRLDPGSRWVYEEIDCKLSPVLSKSTLRGISLDQALLNSQIESEERKIAFIEKEVRKAWGEFNLRSPAQKLIALEKEGVKLPNARRDTLHRAYLKTGHPLIRLMIAYSVSTKVMSTYLSNLYGLKSVSCQWNLCGTETGRLSSSNPNLQNWPNRMRTLLVARPGTVFVGADYSQLELRLAAALSQDQRMVEAFRNGEDLHAQLAGAVYGKVTPEGRTRAKNANFEVLYGGGPRKLSLMLDIPIREAERLHRTHRAIYPRFHQWSEEQISKAREDSYVTNAFGRRRYLWDINSLDPTLQEKASRQAVNTPIQGTGGDMTKLAMVLISKQIEEIGGWIPLQIHDAIYVEVPEERAKEASEILRTGMLEAIPEALKGTVPFEVSVKISKNLGDA